jgi:hypothetical protein
MLYGRSFPASANVSAATTVPDSLDETREGRITRYVRVAIILTRSAVHKALASYLRSYQPSAVAIQPRQS